MGEGWLPRSGWTEPAVIARIRTAPMPMLARDEADDLVREWDWLVARLEKVSREKGRAERELARVSNLWPVEMMKAAADEYRTQLGALGSRLMQQRRVIAQLQVIVDDHAAHYRPVIGKLRERLNRSHAAWREQTALVAERDTTVAALTAALRSAPMPYRESTLGDEWDERYGEWWHENASEDALARSVSNPQFAENEK
jgi:hypothetical protein